MPNELGDWIRTPPRQRLSIVLPAHNEQDNVAAMHAALCAATVRLSLDIEFIFVDDGSTDATRQQVTGLAAADARVRLVALTRNFGHQAALLAGLAHATGDAVISMDCDLQHPPALVPQMVAAWRAGAAIVETVRDETVGVGPLKRATSHLFYRFINLMSDTSMTPGAADFRLLSRKAVDDLLNLRDQRPFLRGMVAWLGYPHTTLHYVAGERRAGRSSYSLRRMISLAIDAITAFSAQPLRLAFHIGVTAALLTLCYLVLILYRCLLGEVVAGWTSLMLVVLFLGATQLITLGVLGEYIGRIYDQTRGRPRFLVDEQEATPLRHQAAATSERADRVTA